MLANLDGNKSVHLLLHKKSEVGKQLKMDDFIKKPWTANVHTMGRGERMQGVRGNLAQAHLFCASTVAQEVRGWEAIKDGAYKEVMASECAHKESVCLGTTG
jgi:hypothetical protein